MRFELKVSLRYLLSPRSDTTISHITAVAVLGVILGVAALVVAMAVMNGYQTNLVRAMAGPLPHISIYPQGKSGFEDRDGLIKALRERYHPTNLSSFMLKETLITGSEGTAGTIQGAMLRGIDPKGEGQVEEFLALLNDGSEEWEQITPEERALRARGLVEKLAPVSGQGASPVLLSPLMARKLKVKIGDRLTPMIYPRESAGFSPSPGPRDLMVVGYIETGIPVFDELVLVMHISQLPLVLPDKSNVVALGLRLEEPLKAGEVASLLRRDPIGDTHSYSVYSWLESNKGLFKVIRFQKAMLFIAMMAIVIIAFFGMISALTVMVAEKTKEISILKSLGATEREIMNIFLLQGVMIGLIGTTLGAGLGLLICWGLDNFPLIEIPPGVYPGTNKIPVLVSLNDMLLVFGGTLLVCIASPFIPARKAMKLLPAEGLRLG